MRHTLFWLLSMVPFTVQSEITCRSDSSVVVNNTDSKHHVYVGTGYGSDMMYSGLSVLKDQPYWSADLTYSYRNMVTVYACAYNLRDVEPTVAFYDFSVGASHAFSKTFDASLFLCQYSTAQRLHETYFGNSTYAVASVGADWKVIYSKATYGYMFGAKPSNYLQISNSRYLASKGYWGNKLYLWSDPTANIVFGNKYSVYTFTKKGRGKPQTITEYKRNFGLLDLEIAIPMSVNYLNTTLEINPSYYFPFHKDPDFPGREGFYLHATLYVKLI